MFSAERELTKALRDTLARAALSRLFIIDNGKLANQIARLVAIVVKCLFVCLFFCYLCFSLFLFLIHLSNPRIRRNQARG